MKSLLTISIAILCYATAGAAALTGAWRGELRMGPMSLPLVFNFTNDNEGNPRYTLDSPQQNVTGLPLTIDFISPDSVSLSSSKIGASFHGKITDQKITGNFIQRGMTFPISLLPLEPLSVRRPQTPIPPFPYQTIDTTFTSSDGTVLAGTFTIPDVHEAKMPVVVMVTGNGPQNRDEEIFEHKPFAVIADFLARHGIASLRYDDRGTGMSAGNFNTSTIFTFKDDAAAALQLAKGLEGADKTGLLGHSEGGTIAMMLAAESQPDFIISLAGMAISGKETILDQNKLLMNRLGMSASEIESSMKVIDAAFDEIITQARENRNAPIDIDKISAELGVTVPPMVMQSIRMNMQKRIPSFDTLLSINPQNDFPKISCKVLALNGTLDTQVDTEKNLTAIKHGIKNAETHQLEGLNHLLQQAVTGYSDEYANIKETISHTALTIITDFIFNLK